MPSFSFPLLVQLQYSSNIFLLTHILDILAESKCTFLVKIFNNSIYKVLYIQIMYINPAYAMAEI